MEKLATRRLNINKAEKNERAVARPSVLYENKIYKMWFCYEKKLEDTKLVMLNLKMEQNGKEMIIKLIFIQEKKNQIIK